MGINPNWPFGEGETVGEFFEFRVGRNNGVERDLVLVHLQLYFTRLAFQGSQTIRYQGGTAQNLWKYEDGAPEATPLTKSYAGTSKNPMVWNRRIYFLSDRDGGMNLWSMDESGANAKQPTIGKLLDDAMVAIERDNSALKGVLPRDYARPALDKQRLGQLINKLETGSKIQVKAAVVQEARVTEDVNIDPLARLLQGLPDILVVLDVRHLRR